MTMLEKHCTGDGEIELTKRKRADEHSRREPKLRKSLAFLGAVMGLIDSGALDGPSNAERKRRAKGIFHTNAPIRAGEQQPKRNDPCNCGSGKKFKKCCLLTSKENTRDEK